MPIWVSAMTERRRLGRDTTPGGVERMDIFYAVFIAPFVDMATAPIFFVEVIMSGG